jgi:hypothetical protein
MANVCVYLGKWRVGTNGENCLSLGDVGGGNASEFGTRPANLLALLRIKRANDTLVTVTGDWCQSDGSSEFGLASDIRSFSLAPSNGAAKVAPDLPCRTSQALH